MERIARRAAPAGYRHAAALEAVASVNGITTAAAEAAIAAGNPYALQQYNRFLIADDIVATTSTETEPALLIGIRVSMLANGYFTRHPIQGFAALFLGFVLACSAAPAFELLLEGL